MKAVLARFGQKGGYNEYLEKRFSTRWALKLDVRERFFWLGFKTEGKLEGEEWRDGSEYFAVAITPHFELGLQHHYYDGPHCSFSLGFLHFCWSYWWCKKCFPENKK